MKPFKTLEKELSELRLEASKIRNDGVILSPDFWLDSTGNGTTKKTYYRKRWFDSDGNKHSEPLTREAYAELKRELDACRELTRIEKQIQRVTAQIERQESLLKQCGVSPKAHKNKNGDADATPEWYTPQEFIEMARSVLGQIDIDPASNPIAQGWVKATKFYTREDDGLIQPWSGRVWCNPPYGKFTKLFLQRGVELCRAGDIEACIFLVNRTGAAWYVDLIEHFDAVCQVRKRIAFLNQQGIQEGSPRYYNDFLYLGADVERFKEVFSTVGRV